MVQSVDAAAVTVAAAEHVLNMLSAFVVEWAPTTVTRSDADGDGYAMASHVAALVSMITTAPSPEPTVMAISEGAAEAAAMCTVKLRRHAHKSNTGMISSVCPATTNRFSTHLPQRGEMVRKVSSPLFF